ncbi:hypothetical protein VOLCADRAFT_92047 [Volvox carteri f. nagariensis]|uniref:Uncharacterized protein n=1 Tax=Volvox carteri f. nagariensis TaxID=3068 RepID=D8TYZ1_VOLCA|nr:uncharacterized protein VOLCADRAFT_92047 [Volvox carteri f. nagariensis]EFJ47302.1 hypothetical protein VOLCADRAFT_92047 [Volvox carteri f. nagariensis]|eukprot:XP_002951491.1 hypothetical protein VOLCADRAFT_92047 [Volvox carteri f. nagariensis]
MLLQPRRLSLISLPGSQIRLNGAWTQRLKARCSNGSVQPPATAPSRRRPPSKDSNENGRRRVPDPTSGRPGAHQQILQQRGGADSSDGQGSQGTSRHGAVAAPAVTTPAATNTVSGRHLNRSAPSNVVTPLQSTTAANSAISNHHLVHTGTYIHNSYARPGSEPSTNSQQLPPARRGHGPLEPQRRVDQTKRPAGHGGASWDQRSFSDDGSGSSTRSSSTSMANPSDAAPNRQLTGWKSDGAANGSGGGGVGGGRKTAMSFKGAAKQINADIMEAGRKGNWQLVAQHGAQFNSVNAATALHRLGSCGLQPGSWEARKLLTDPRFAQLERLAEAHVPSFGPREAANCLWALAKLGCDPPPSKDNDADLNQSYGGKGDGAHLGGLMSRSRGGSAVAPAAAADHDHDHDDGTGSTGRSSASSEAGGSLLAALCGRMEVLLECLGQQEVTNVLWALGTLGHHPGEALLRNLSMRLLGLLAEVPPQGIASSLLGLAKLGWSPGPYVLDQVARGSVAKIGEFNAQALSNTMWSLARLGYYNPQLQDAMFRQALRRLSEFSPQGISNLIWAAATLGLTVVSEGDGNGSGRPGGCGEGEKGGGSTIPSGDVPEPLLRTFCDQAAVSLQSYSPQNISNLLWSTAKMGYLHEPLMRAAATQAAGQLAAEVEEREGREEEQLEEEAEENDRGDSSASASSSSSSNMRRRDGDRRGGGGGGRATGAWNSQEVANATWAYATLGFQPGAEFLKQVSPKGGSSFFGFSRWRRSASRNRIVGPELWGQMMELLGRLAGQRGHAGGGGGGGGERLMELPEEAMRQLYQAYMNVRCDYPTAVLAPGPPGLLHRAAELWRFRSVWAVQVSGLQQSVSEAMTRLGLSHTVEWLVDNGDFSIDLAMELEIPVETAVPSHATQLQRGQQRQQQQQEGRWNQATWPPEGSVKYSRLRSIVTRMRSYPHPHLLPLMSWTILPHLLDMYDRCTSPPTPVLHLIDIIKFPSPGKSLGMEAAYSGGIDREIGSRTSSSSRSRSRKAATKVLRVAVEVDGPTHFTSNTRQPLSTTLYRRRCLEARGWVVDATAAVERVLLPIELDFMQPVVVVVVAVILWMMLVVAFVAMMAMMAMMATAALLVAQHGAQFNSVNAATAMHRLGSCGLQPGSWEARKLLTDPRFAQLERLAAGHLPSFDGPEVANCMWALAKLGYRAPAAVAKSQGRRAVSTGASGSLGGGGSGRALLLQGLSDRAGLVLQQLTSQTVAKTLWALGRMGHHPGEVLLRNLCDRLLQVLPQASHQDVSNSLLGLAKLGWSPGPYVLDQVARGSVAKIGEFNAQELSNMMWSLAHVKHCNAKLQTAIFQQAGFYHRLLACWLASWYRRAHDGASAAAAHFTYQELSNLLWSTAKMGYLHEPLMRAAARQAARQLAAEVEEREGREEEQLEDENGRGDSSGGGEEDDLAAAECRAAASRPSARGCVRSWSSQAVSNTTWAFATLGLHPGVEFLNQPCPCVQLQVAGGRQHGVGPGLTGTPGHGGAEGGGEGGGGQDQKREREQQRDQEHEGKGEAGRGRDGTTDAIKKPPGRGRGGGSGGGSARGSPAEQFSKQEISNSVWAAGRLQVYDPRVMDAVAEHVCAHRLPYLKPQEVANIAWAFGALRHAHKPLMDGLVRRAVHFMSTPPSSSSSSLSSPSSSSSSSSLSSATPFQISPSMPLLSPCPSSSSPSAHRRYDNPHDEDVVTRRPPVSGSLKMQELASICGAVGLFGWRYPALLEATTRRLTAYINQATQSTSPSAPTPRHETIQGIQHQHQQQEAHRAERCQPQQQQQELKARDIVNLSWGLSLVGGCSPELWGQMMELLGQLAGQRGHAGGGGGGERLMELPQEELVQIYQTFLHVQLDFPVTTATAGPDAGGGLHTSPPGLLVAGREAWRQLSQQGAQVSSFQWEVSKTLTRLGLNHSVELLTSGGKFSIDLALELVAEVEMEMEQAKEDNMESGEVMGPAALTEQPKQQQPQPHLHYQPRGRDEGKRRGSWLGGGECAVLALELRRL